LSETVRQPGEAREDHEGFEASISSCYPFPDALGITPDQGVSGHGEGQEFGASETRNGPVLGPLKIELKK
jgi:hypothetical protein